MVAPGRIELPTPGFSVLCSTDWATEPNIYFFIKKMAVPTRFEPAIFCVTGRRVNPYTTEPFYLINSRLFKYTKNLILLSSTLLIFLIFFNYLVNLYDKTKQKNIIVTAVIKSKLKLNLGINAGIEPITKPIIIL